MLRPLVEQLLDVAAVGAGMSVLDVRPPSADLIRALPHCTAVAVTDGEGAATALRDELRAARAEARVVTAPLTALPFDTGAFDIVLSLFGLTASRGGAVALGEVARVGRRAVVVVWDGGATLENTLRAALAAVTGTEPPSLLRALEPPPAPRWSRQQLADVARFDSVAQLVSALTEQYHVDVDATQRASLAAHVELSLAACIGADGTLRVPLRATALTQP